jgi:tRNA threonylcarbamoyl adenosine modification protein (Sua5/YciO/YrdC/YwlC family)
LDDPALVQAVSAVLTRDGCVVLPTDTVYGVAAQASSAAGVDRLQAAKGRGDAFPPPLLVADLDCVAALAFLPDAALALAQEFWPGALTLVLPLRPGARVASPGADGTVGVRVPDHAALRDLLRETGPLACSSANRHDHAPAVTVAQAWAELGESVALYVDGGPTPGPIPSTVVAFVGGEPKVLRAGRLEGRLG